MVKQPLSTKFEIMEIEMKNITKKLDEHISDNKEDIKGLSSKIDTVLTKLDNKYAGKWVEKISIGLAISIISGIVLFAAMR